MQKAVHMNCFFVPGTGFEPARPFEHHHLKVACLPISTPGLNWVANVKCLPHLIKFFLKAEKMENEK